MNQYLLAFIYVDNVAAIWFNTNENWEEAINNHSSENSGWETSGNVYYDGQPLFDGSGNSVYYGDVIDPYTNYTFSSDPSGGSSGGLLELPIEFATIYYEAGEMWEDAINLHPSENSSWRIIDGHVYFYDSLLYMGPDIQVESMMPIIDDPSYYHF